jgi:hypothetical protein
VVSTRVFMMAPRALTARQPYVDVTAAMDERPRERSVALRVVAAPSASTTPLQRPSDGAEDPFADVVI